INEKIPQNKTESENPDINENSQEIKVSESSNIIELNNSQRRLVRYISANTGVLKNEIIRRCARKKRSLGQITTTVCLLLIAKEQGMEMNELLDGIN
ncbi:MAG: DUF2240 family protein, partial [Candidatus Thermoplasmatota archaeon]|nr:DUF2240 family protein [Candidatus Thermoplasmatota archaeon]